MEGLLRPDIWHFLIARYFRVRDLCALRRCNRQCLRFWSSDGAWLLQRDRICAMFPGLWRLFKTHTGILHIFRNILTIGFSMNGIFRLVRQRTSDQEAIASLIACIARAHIPHQQRFGEFYPTLNSRGSYTIWARAEEAGFHFTLRFDEDVYYPDCTLRFIASEESTRFHLDDLYYVSTDQKERHWFFAPWRVVVCECEGPEATYTWRCRDQFEHLMEPTKKSRTK